ncbi:ammonium transporter [Oecophyllibacter saccharovorans]|uniref:Ammonium transporter n=1 Tax=Oecophyllibacter saccharovorans TaxID=2558360 RepID=A0A506URL1_9PROT|nr:ammonium transporter [Oecophyllibacter saccharovorans]TPW35984.1 ammonium transporter [Oecophyllibacter saccharovorans]
MKVDGGHTAWMLISAALVLMMTIPGIGLFYAGMVRRKNVLSTLAQSFVICCLVSLAWMLLGYSLAFTNGTPWLGGLERLGLRGVADNFLLGPQGADRAFILGAGLPDAVPTTLPESVYLLFQMGFAVIAPAIITGAVAGRVRFAGLCVFSVLWSLLVYAPLAHWVWSPGGWLARLGALDYAGGTVVHVNAGIAGLVCAIMLGRRRGIGQEDMSPWNLVYALIGAALLWIGWFGFNAGSALAADSRAGMAMLVTQLAAAAGGCAWMGVEWCLLGKPTALGIVSGALAGLVGITPAAGFVLPWAALPIGGCAALGWFFCVTRLKHWLKYDDTLDAFGIHGIGGIIGALLTGVLAWGPLSATAITPGISGSLSLLGRQAEAVAVTVLWSAVMTALLVWGVDRLVSMRVSEDEEQEGLDLTQHGERLN